jgi:hypothetical protein
MILPPLQGIVHRSCFRSWARPAAHGSPAGFWQARSRCSDNDKLHAPRLVLTRGEAADACRAGTLRQLSHQFGAEPPALPVIDDGDRDLGGLRVVGVPDVAGDADTAPAGMIKRAERLMVVVVVVDVGEVAQLGR